MNIPRNHPRRASLLVRERLVGGFEGGLVAKEGLIAHGRGEAFDYLLGEKTTAPAKKAIKAAAACILLSKHPVISVNGNVAALAAREVVELARECNAKVEVNLFYKTQGRVEAIARRLGKFGLREVLGVNDATAKLPELLGGRRMVSPEGIYCSDCVLVPLEDGDRTQALKRMGKKVIAIDLNPLSRTAKAADITIVDNITRALPSLISKIRKIRKKKKASLEHILREYDNRRILKEARRLINLRLHRLAVDYPTP